MAGRRPAISNTEPRLGGLRVQTSLYGQTIPVVFGRTQITGNLIGYWGFRATRQEERSEAAKGGASRPSRIYYEYSASVAMLLGEGPITAVRTIWKGKQRFAGEATTTLLGSASHAASVPASSPYTITVPSAASWTGTVRVAVRASDPLSWPPYDQPLVAGIDYTVSVGVYTFAAEHANKPISIEYTTSVTASAANAIAQLGLSLSTGTLTQSAWSYLATNYPADAVPYVGFAYVRGQDYELTSAAEVENHRFEVDGFLPYDSDGDAHPRDVVKAILTNTRYGVGWSSAYLADWSSFAAYCDAFGLYISPAYTQQRAARDCIADILEACNTDAAWTGSTLRLVPRGDENAGSYVAPITPVFDLSADDFVVDDTDNPRPPITFERASQAEVPNVVRAEFANRARDYAYETIAAEDEASIIAQGRREEAAQTWHFFCDGAVRAALQLRLQRHQAVRDRASFRLDWRFAELELGDLVTLTEPSLYLDRWPARVVSIAERGDDFDVVVEAYPIGHATAPVVAPQLGSGFRPDYNADPGNVAPPVFFEPPGSYVQSGLEVWAAVSGQAGNAGAMWGGAEVYASLDGGASYKRVARVDQGARYGSLNASLVAGSAAALDIALAGRGGQLRSVSGAEADSNTTLAFVGPPASGEFVAFETATLTGLNTYRLSGLRRGLYGTTDQVALPGAPFVYVDGAIAMSGPLPTEMIGRTIKFKFCSFNVFGGGLQSLEQVEPYEYVVTGRFRETTVPTKWSGNLLQNASLQFGTEGWSLFPFASPAYVVRQTQTMGSPTQALAGPPAWNAMVEEQGAGAVASTATLTAWAPDKFIACAPGDRIGAACSVELDGCDAQLGLGFYYADGSFIPNSAVLSAAVSKAYVGAGSIANYVRREVYGTAPEGAAGVRLLAYKRGTKSPASTSRMWVAQPDLRVLVGPDAMPPWSTGPAGVVPTAALADGASSRTVRYTNDTGLTMIDGNVFIDVPIGTIVCEAAGTVSISVTCEVVCAGAISGAASEITLTLYQTGKIPLNPRSLGSFTAGSGAQPRPVTMTGAVVVSAGDTISPLLRLSRTRYGVGVGNAIDAVKKIESTITLLKR